MKSVSLENQASGAGPSWATKPNTGRGFGGFQDLSGFEAKTAPAPTSPAPDASNSAPIASVKGLAAQSFSLTPQGDREIPGPVAASPDGGISSRPVWQSKELSEALNPMVSTDQPPAIIRHSKEFIERQAMPMGQFPPSKGIFDTFRERIEALPNVNGTRRNLEVISPNAATPEPTPVAPQEAAPVPAIQPQSANDNKKAGVWRSATATAYNGKEAGDTYGSETAHPGLNGKRQAVEGETVAVDGKTIPFGSTIEVMLADGTIKRVYGHDTGSAVKNRTASKARGNNFPVIDFYTQGDPNAVNGKIGNVVKYRVLSKSEANA